MLSSKISSLQFNTDKNRPSKQGMIFAVKIILTAIFIGGTAFVTLDVWSYFHNSSQDSLPAPAVLDAAVSNLPSPTKLTIPSLKINAAFVPLGLNPDQTLEVPKTASEVGWFIYGAKPGDLGPSVVVGHLGSAKGTAVFANLNKIKPGDKIIITRADNSEVTYQVDSLSNYEQNNFPTAEVYGPISFAGLRLITCSGTYIKSQGHYSDNLVVFAKLVPLHFNNVDLRH